MGAKQDELRAIADLRFGSGSPTTWYVGVSTTVSNADGSGFTEPVGNGYARVAVTNDVTRWPAAATVGGRTTKKNGQAVTFPNPSGPWGTLVEYGIFTGPSGGTPRYTNALNSQIAPKSGNTPVEFAANTIELPWSGS